MIEIGSVQKERQAEKETKPEADICFEKEKSRSI